MGFDAEKYRLNSTAGFEKIVLVIGIAGLAISFIGYFVNGDQFFHSYLTAYIFWLTLALGGLFAVMLHHLTGATWSVVLRRIFENIMIVLPVMALLFIPLFFGIHNLYHWSHADAVAHDHLLQQKSPYLNTPFFIIRAIAFLVIWSLFARALYKSSLNQDAGYSENQIPRMRRISAFGMVVFALSVTYASFDWLMSLDAHWYSTIFGAYVFGGSVLGIMALVTLICIWLRGRNTLTEEISTEHYHDLGKLTFAFAIFWAYMAFSQYFLIWYGNIPEETIFYQHRWVGSWKAVSLMIVFGHFVVPFFIMITRAAKRNLSMLGIMVVLLLLMHWVDIFWLVMPNLHHHGAHISWMDVTATVGIGGIFLWVFLKQMRKNPIIPVNDPKLKDSIKFENI
ncbi:MAG: hypothetical protein GF307_10465 [candidate division Zixibacteria bacterium]|nr:hypothetical protein [candidate division Zixibacteria bacterium]